MTPPREQALAWAYDGAAHLRALMARMGDDAFAAPSGLPGWSRAHVLSHVARNADALGNLLVWARTGVRTPAYASREQRDADIAAGATRPPGEIRDDVVASSDRLAVAVGGMPERAWSVQVTGPGGGEIPASAVPWFRAREMWIHAVDLDVGASFGDMPRPMVVALVGDLVAALSGRDGCPTLRVAGSDGPEEWALGPPGGSGDTAGAEPGSPEIVTGPVAHLAAWLSGRSRGRRAPAVPRWA